MAMFEFHSPNGGVVSPIQWIAGWSGKFSSDKYPEDVYQQLVARGLELYDAEFEILGAWKEGSIRICRAGRPFGNCSVAFTGRWKPRAVVAYEVWLSLPHSRSALEQHLNRGEHRSFLDDLSQKSFPKACKGGGITNAKFGLSRATYVLHVLSRAKFPIYDSNTQAGIYLLTRGRIAKSKTASIDPDWYLRIFCPIIRELQEVCSASDLPTQRALDKALFCYGKEVGKKRPSLINNRLA